MGLSKLAILVVGSAVAVLLASKPRVLLWGTTIFTLVISGTVGYFFPSAKVITWIAYGAAAMMFVYVFGSGRVYAPRTPSDSALTFFLLLTIFIACISTAYNTVPLFQLIVALKSLVLMGGIWVFFANVGMTATQLRRWLLLVLVIALMQWLPAIYQYVFVRGSRLARGLGDIEASDSVVGTFGGSMESGGLTAVLAFFLVLTIVALAALKSERQITLRQHLFASVLCLLPLAIMEVKVIFFYFPIAFLVLFRRQLIERPFKSFVSILVLAALLGGLLFAYQFFHWSSRSSHLSSSIENAFSYSFESESGYFAQEEGLLTRRGTVDYWVAENLDNPGIGTLIGHGLGSSRTNGQVLGQVAREHYPRNIDRTGLALFLWDIGILGVASILGIFVSAFFVTARIGRAYAQYSWERAVLRTLNAALPMLLMSLLYRNDIPYAAPMMFIFYSIFGINAWMRRSLIRQKARAMRGERVAPRRGYLLPHTASSAPAKRALSRP